MADIDTLLRSFIDILDVMAELYLSSIVKPFLLLHEEFSTKLSDGLVNILRDHKNHVPGYFTETTVAYSRIALIMPTLMLLAWGQLVLPAILVLLVNFVGLFLDQQFWAKVKLLREQGDVATSDGGPDSRSPTPCSDDDDDNYEYEVVTTGSPQRMDSWSLNHRKRTYGAFVAAMCDTAFTVPCWIYLLSTIPTTQFRSIQYLSLCWLIVTETASSCARFRSFFVAGGLPSLQVEDLEFSKSSIQGTHLSAVKHTLEAVGTTFLLLPYLRHIGMLFLALACPLAYESIRQILKKRVVYVICSPNKNQQPFLDTQSIKFWMQARALGSHLIVGVVNSGISNHGGAEMAANACSTTCVDEVIVDAPAKVDLMFLEKQQVDYVVFAADHQKGTLVTDEVIAAGVCIVIGDDNVARLLLPKEESKKE